MAGSTRGNSQLDIRSLVAHPVYRVGFGPNPWTFPEWQYADEEDHRFHNRWDDPDGNWRMLYVGSTLYGCYLEVLAHFRPKADVYLALDSIVDDGYGEDYPTIGPGRVPGSWRKPRAAGSARLEGHFCRVSSSITIGTLRQHLMPAAYRNGLDDLDAGALRLPAPRAFTQEVSAWLYRWKHPSLNISLTGIQYQSRHGDEVYLWAIYERRPDSRSDVCYCSDSLIECNARPIDWEDSDLQRAMERLGLTWED